MVKDRVRYLCTSKNKVNRGLSKGTTNANPVMTFNKISSLTERDNIFLKRKMTTVWRAVDNRLRQPHIGSQRFERRSQDGGSNGTTWGDITKESEEEMQRGVERGLRG